MKGEAYDWDKIMALTDFFEGVIERLPRAKRSETVKLINAKVFLTMVISSNRQASFQFLVRTTSRLSLLYVQSGPITIL